MNRFAILALAALAAGCGSNPSEKITGTWLVEPAQPGGFESYDFRKDGTLHASGNGESMKIADWKLIDGKTLEVQFASNVKNASKIVKIVDGKLIDVAPKESSNTERWTFAVTDTDLTLTTGEGKVERLKRRSK
jgi:hypothetical protein